MTAARPPLSFRFLSPIGRSLALAGLTVGAALALMSCGDPSDEAALAHLERADLIDAAAPIALEGFMASIEDAHRRREADSELRVSFAGQVAFTESQALGREYDVFIGTGPGMMNGLHRPPVSTHPWLKDPLVVIASAGSGVGVEDLLEGNDRVAIAAESTPLGQYTRVALRLVDAWYSVESRATQLLNIDELIESVADGDARFGIVHSTHIAGRQDRIRIVGTLDVPERMEIAYTIGVFTDRGADFARWLRSEAILDMAQQSGLVPIRDAPGPD